jgi:hypothetical protein
VVLRNPAKNLAKNPARNLARNIKLIYNLL